KFNKLCDSYSPEIRDALILAKDEFYKIANEFKNINIRYRSKEIGLEYFDSSGPRNKVLGLVGIYPERAMIAFGIEGWEKLIISKDILKKIKSFPRSVKNEKQIIVLVKLLKDALIKVKNI
ncbi:hypothetical protein KKE99_00205, partial [Patescibacteria group bacterium]|nr:hypothetical protein [Patescibacteria group bacterium]